MQHKFFNINRTKTNELTKSLSNNPPPSMLTQISLQTSLHMAIPLLKPLKHPTKQLPLILEPSRQVVHIGVGWLTL